MIKVMLKNNEVLTFELGEEKKELELVTRFHHGLDGNTVLNLKTGNRSVSSRIKVADIKNMQQLKNVPDDLSSSVEGSRFKTRKEYEQWKEQKLKENQRAISQKRKK